MAKRHKINCLVIGLGRIGFELHRDPHREKPCTHTQAILDHPQTHLYAGIDIDPLKRKAFARETSTPCYPDWESFLKHNHLPDIVFIATPPDNHGEYLRFCFQSQIPVAVVEKPITADYNEAIALKQTLTKSKTRVVVNHERRFADDYRYLKKIIDNKKYGDLLSLSAYLFTGLTSNYQTLHHDGTHLIDIVDFLTKTKSKSIQIKNLIEHPQSNKDKSLKFSLNLNSIPCFFEIGGKKQFFHFEIHLIFKKGIVHIGNHIFKEWGAVPDIHYQGFTTLSPKKKKFTRTHFFSNMLKHAVDLYKHPHLASQSSIQDSLLVFKIIEGLKIKK